MNLLTYWQPIAAALATAVIAFGLHSAAARVTEINHQNELISQKEKIRAECNAAQQQTKDLSDAYQKKIADLNTRIAAALRVPAHCIMPRDTRPASGGNAATRDKGLSNGNGVSTGYLLEFAGRCETVGQQLDTCQATVGVIEKACRGN